MDATTKKEIDWITDLILKGFVGVSTVLLGIAVNSLNSMNSEIKELADSVNSLTVSSTIVIQSQKSIEIRLTKQEAENEMIRNRLRDLIVEIEVMKKAR